MSRVFVLQPPPHPSRRLAQEAIQQAPDGMIVQIKEPTRSGEASAKFHAICGDLEKSGFLWMGKARTAAEWKVLLISGHTVATKGQVDIVPGLENEWVNIRESSAAMGIGRMSSLIEYAHSFCALNCVKLTNDAK